jgi:hypothetical protein
MAYPSDLWTYPLWPTLTPDMLFWPVWPVSPTMPHYVTLAQLSSYINPGGATTIAPGYVLGNPTGAPAAAIPTSLSSIIDQGIGAVRGSILYRGATAWLALAPSTNGYVLATSGAGADPRWAIVSSLPGGTNAPVNIGDTPPASPVAGMLWWDDVGGQLYVYYDDGTSQQWVAATDETGSAGGGGGATLPSGIPYDQLIYLGGSWAGYRPRYIMSCFVPGVLTSSQYLLLHRVSKAVTFPANFGSYLGHTSQARGTANATASAVIDVQKATSAAPGTFSSVGTITIAAGAMVGTFASSGGAAIGFAQGDSLAMLAPASADATFANFAATLVGYET